MELKDTLEFTALKTITSFPIYSNFSLDEIRLSDYAYNRGVPRRKSRSRAAATMPLPPDHLVLAAAPLVEGRAYRSCRAPVRLATDLGASTVTLHVGPEDQAKDFVVHRNLIERRSKAMCESMSGEWKDQSSCVISLPEDEPDIVALYQQWLYTGCIITTDPSSPNASQEYRNLVKCYILGDKFLDGAFKDCTIDSIVSLLVQTHLFDPTLSTLVYDSTTPNSPLRKLWQAIYIFCGSASWLSDTNAPHPQFSLDLSRKQMQSLPAGGTSILLEHCRYHEHDEGKCYRSTAVPVQQDSTRGVISALWS